MKKNKWIVQFMTIMVFGIFLSSCAIYHHYGPYYGKVVDAETKQPLEGAAVLAVYYTQSYGPAGPISHYLDAQETVTDKNGEFKIPSLNSFAFRPLQSFEPYTWFTIFKPSYGCYPDHKKAKPMFLPNGSLPASQFVVVELPTLKTIEDRKKNLFDCGVNYDIPYKTQKNYFDLRNTEAIQIGKEPWPIPEVIKK
jgi:hypothetical protein